MMTQLDPKVSVALNDTAKLALKTWNHRDQCVAAAEEFCELSVRLLQYANNKPRPELEAKIQEEIADSYIMLEQMSMKFFPSVEALRDAICLKNMKLVNKIHEDIERPEAKLRPN